MEAYYGSEGFSYAHKLDTDAKANAYVRHAHTGYEIFHLISGEAALVVGRRRFSLAPGDLALLPSAVYHFVDILSPARYEREVFHFESLNIEENVLRTVFATPTVLHIEAGSEVARVLPRFSELCREFAGEALSRLLPNLLVELIYRISRHNPTCVPSVMEEENRLVASAMRYLDRNPSVMRIEELCAALYVSRSTLQRAFHEALGVSPMRYASLRRLLRAQTMIALGDTPTAVSAALGYRDYSAFYRAYRARFGHSPRTGQGEVRAETPIVESDE